MTCFYDLFNIDQCMLWLEMRAACKQPMVHEGMAAGMSGSPVPQLTHHLYRLKRVVGLACIWHCCCCCGVYPGRCSRPCASSWIRGARAGVCTWPSGPAVTTTSCGVPASKAGVCAAAGAGDGAAVKRSCLYSLRTNAHALVS
jgi:hypothetical protein